MRMSTLLLTSGALLLASAAFAAGPPSAAELHADEATAFAQADADASGTLSFDEFKNFESLMREMMMQHRFHDLDTNGDGTVSLDELQAGRPGPGWGPGHGRPPF